MAGCSRRDAAPPDHADARRSTASRSIARSFGDTANEAHFSATSLWEIAIKRSLGREDLRADARLLRRNLLDNGYQQLAISGEHVLATEALPPPHRDPFDRLLFAQAVTEGMTLPTGDAIVAGYPAPVRKV